MIELYVIAGWSMVCLAGYLYGLLVLWLTPVTTSTTITGPLDPLQDTFSSWTMATTTPAVGGFQGSLVEDKEED